MEKILSTVRITEFNKDGARHKHLDLDPKHLKLDNNKYQKYIVSSLKGDLLSNKEDNKLVNYSIIISDKESDNKRLFMSKKKLQDNTIDTGVDIVPITHINTVILFSKDLRILKQKIYAYNKYTNDYVVSEEVNSKGINKDMEDRFKAEELGILGLFNMYKKITTDYEKNNLRNPDVNIFNKYEL